MRLYYIRMIMETRINLTYKQKKELAEWIAIKNYGAVTGSIMLRERGIELGREPKDIDIVISDTNPDDLVLPPLVEGEEYNENEDGYKVLARCYFFGTKIEFLTDEGNVVENSRPISGLFGANYASIQDLLEAKKRYVEEDTNAEYVEKSKRDIEIIEKHISEQQEREEESNKEALNSLSDLQKKGLIRTIDVKKAIAAQIEYLKQRAEKNEGDWMNEDFAKGIGFSPQNGICYRCHRQIYDNAIIKQRNFITGNIEDVESKGISVEEASTELTTGCPHCHYSFVD